MCASLSHPIDTPRFPITLPQATGFTQPTADFAEVGIDFNQLIYRHPAATYVMRAARNDLVADDLVIIDAAVPSQPGDLVVGQIEDTFLLCRFHRQDGAILLVPENVAYQPQMVTAETAPDTLFGVCTYILHHPKRQP